MWVSLPLRLSVLVLLVLLLSFLLLKVLLGEREGGIGELCSF
jgi:hypothetical protein